MVTIDYLDALHSTDREARRLALAALLLKEYSFDNNITSNLDIADRQSLIYDIEEYIQRIAPPLLAPDNPPSPSPDFLTKVRDYLHLYIHHWHCGVLRARTPKFFKPCRHGSYLLDGPIWWWRKIRQLQLYTATGWEPLPDNEEDQEDDVSEDEMQTDSDNEGSE